MSQSKKPYQIGKFYHVPVLYAPMFGQRKSDHWPIFGPKHDDREIIGFSDIHYHFDFRFLTKRQMEIMAKSSYGESDIIVTVTRINPVWEHRTVKKKCQRPFPHFPIHKARWCEELLNAYQHKTLTNGRICPHRGADLSTIAPDQHGRIQCPLHGLIWCAHTGQLDIDAMQHQIQTPIDLSEEKCPN